MIDAQQNLFTELVDPIVPREATIKERFEAFHLANPHVYAAIVRMSLKAQARGIERWSMKGIFEVLRWTTHVETKTGDGWKLNNVFTAHYARMVMDREPELAGFFETRERRAD